MDEDLQSSPEVISIHPKPLDPTKKRKLACEHLEYPPAKHIFRGQYCGFKFHKFEKHSSTIDFDIVIDSWTNESGSFQDSNSVEECDTGNSSNFPSFSSPVQNGCNGFKNVLIEENNETPSTSGNYSSGRMKSKTVSSISEAHFLDLETEYEEFMFPEEENIEEKDQDLTLYSNWAKPDLYLLSSGRWGSTEETDAQPDVKRGTIDREFEQYFSTLML